ncbi:MAG TPA: hypothetical protein VGG73_11995 [Vicinamibacterales bacterium]|jgi:hypothetical protein
MKTILILVLTGTLLGIVVASLVVPPALSWYSAPGGLPEGAKIQAVVEIPEIIRYATGKLMLGQAIGGAIGAALGLGAGIYFGKKARVPAA